MSGAMFFGSSADGSDMKPVLGCFESPCGKYFSSEPYNAEQKQVKKEHGYLCKIIDWTAGRRTFQDEYELIQKKKSRLPRPVREYLVALIENPETLHYS